RCEHIMALHFDPRGDYEEGIARCVVSRTGDVEEPGFIDRSRIHAVDVRSPYDVELGPELDIAGSQAVVEDLAESDRCNFLGFEDPNLWCDRESGVLHFYCTVPFLDRNAGEISVYLGHAEGPGLDSLRMTAPVLEPEPDVHQGAKEVAIAPPSSEGGRYNLVESNDVVDDTWYSVLRTAVAPDLTGPWEYGEVALHPRDHSYDWFAGHASPGPLLPPEFVDVGESRRVGLLNGREAERREGGAPTFGSFTVGLSVYDFERGTVEWVSPEPVIEDPAAETITFASAYRLLGPETGLIYAHVDDSFVRAYRVDTAALESYLP
ncbi:hypothetical protein BRC60_03430, partial [Halobacteriales archaeon QH_1_68_42]